MILNYAKTDLSVIPPPPLGFADAELYLNRELSQLEFNRRVLARAQDPTVPLLERLRFLCICSSNLDEFFEIRVAGLKEAARNAVSQAPGPDSLPMHELMRRMRAAADALMVSQYATLNTAIFPALAAEGIALIAPDNWTRAQARWLRRYFDTKVLPVLSPIVLDQAHPFPATPNKCLNLLVALEGTGETRARPWAVMQVPRMLPRLVRLPRWLVGGAERFVLLSAIMQRFVGDLFGDLRVRAACPFRVTRNSDLVIDEDDCRDLMGALTGELSGRHFSGAVRLEVQADCPPAMIAFLLETFALQAADAYLLPGPVSLSHLASLYNLVDRPALKFRPFVPKVYRPRDNDMFKALRRGDILLHHPYESFDTVVAFLQQAAHDPQVLAIKQTLYRTDADSPMIDALMHAAQQGKEVTAVIELRARFDEAANIEHAKRLQRVGVKVVYGVVGYKTHAKMLLVVRREGQRLRRYVHLSTGNYSATTSRLYTDVGLLTADRDIGQDVHALFLQLTGLGRPVRLRALLQSPFGLHQQLLHLIAAETEAARQGRPARILGRVNSLGEPQLILALYRASQAGVRVSLVVRGICCLRPGVPGLSENITVHSVVDRFLEHSRVFAFHADGAELVFCSSADWMPRNFFKRVEVAFPVRDPALRARLVEETLALYLDDNAQVWRLAGDGSYTAVTPAAGQRLRSAQRTLLGRLGVSSAEGASQRP